MNKNEKELLNAINGTERMSGIDSYDDAEGDYAYFEDGDGDFDDIEGYNEPQYGASGTSRPQIISDPYVISYHNTGLVTETAILFGYNDYFGAVNYGNPATLTLTNLQGGTYGRLLAQSNNKFFKIGKWRFQCSTSAQLQVTLNINHVDANGKTYSSPLNLSIMRDAYQQQSDIIDVSKPVTIDGNTFITFSIYAGVIFTISMFPIAIISGKAKLNGGTSVNSARAPRLSGKNVAPVIIQTTQEVKGIAKG